MKGKVKNINTDKGFGFIQAENGTEYFFHSSALRNCKIDDITKGAEVSFEPGQGPKGPRAEDVYTD